MDFEELLASDQARGLLRQAGVTDADDVEWLAGPTPLSAIPVEREVDSDNPDIFELLGTETEVESFVGTVTGEDGPFDVGIHITRVEHEQDSGPAIVIAAGIHRWPVANPGQYQSRTGQRFTAILGSMIIEARDLTELAGQRLRPITY